MAENIFMTPHAAPPQLGLNISDIIDGMPDKDYGENEMSDYVRGGTPSEANCSAVSSMLSRNDPDIEQKKKAYVQIIEQPQPKALRFRYICEGRSAGSIPGVRSTAENKTFPTVKIMNYKGPAIVVVSCVTVDPPYRPHPHNLVGKEGCNKGVCTVTIDNDSMECMFSNLGIQCVKKKDVEQALKLREEIRVDPFSTGFAHRSQPQSIDLNAVRLCFQVFLSNGKGGGFTYPLKPVVSECIYDKKNPTRESKKWRPASIADIKPEYKRFVIDNNVYNSNKKFSRETRLDAHFEHLFHLANFKTWKPRKDELIHILINEKERMKIDFEAEMSLLNKETVTQKNYFKIWKMTTVICDGGAEATSDLNICKLSDCTSCVSGGKEIILLCDKVAKEDIQVKFFEVKDGHIEWEAFGDFQASDVHKQVAISFKTPKYKDIQIENSVKVFVQLFRPSDKSTSEPRPFEYLPMDAGRPFSTFKRLKNNYGLFHRILGLDGPLNGPEDGLPHKVPGGYPPLPGPKIGESVPSGKKTSPTSDSLFAGPSLSPPKAPPPKMRVPPTQPAVTAASNQSIDDIKQRMVANLDKKKQGLMPTTPPIAQPISPSPLWLEDVSVYSDADLLDEVLSQGSVNDLLSVVGDGVAVYEDVDALPQRPDLGPDVLYGDASYASCYSNLEYALGRSKPALPPLLPPKKSLGNSEDLDLDFAIYGTPSSRPVHPDKETLLRERGFLLPVGDSTKREEEDPIYYPPVSDILEVEEESEALSQTKEVPAGEIPQTILDLFV